ncbi:MAG: lmo0937 family membrane protein [Syntrophales bacterium]
MLWAIAVVLIILWMLGMGTGFTMGSFIHVLYAAAVALLVVSLSQEVIINRKLRHISRSRAPKPDRWQTKGAAG